MKKSLHEEIRTRFVKDVAEHTMQTKMDTGLYRHLVFRKNGSSNYWFYLLTFPGRLVIGGDCGTYVFSRAEDMFKFFRMSENDFNKIPGNLSVNPGYWAEKVESQDKVNGIKFWSEDLFKKAIGDRFNSHDFGSKKERSEAWKTVKEELIDRSFDNGYEAHEAVYSFDDEHGILSDFWEDNCEEYTGNYLWCLYAIVWGIEQYDKKKMEEDR